MIYLAMLPILSPHREIVKEVSARIAQWTGLNPPHTSLPTHVTLHPPVSGIQEKRFLSAIESAALNARKMRVRVSGPDHFGTLYIVLPVQPTLQLAKFWTDLMGRLSRESGFTPGRFDDDNTLHITVASRTARVFKQAWPNIVKNVRIEPFEMTAEMAVVFSKPYKSGSWEFVTGFDFPS